MLNKAFIWFAAVQFIIFEGCFGLNTTQVVTQDPQKTSYTSYTTLPLASTSISNETFRKEIIDIPHTFNSWNISTNLDLNASEVIKNILEEFGNETIPLPVMKIEHYSEYSAVIKDCSNETSVNLSCLEQLLKATLETMERAAESSEESELFGAQKSAAIAVGAFLILAVVGYLSCVGYRHYLQRKYGNSQILIGGEVYDTSDLRYFEI